MLERIRVKNDEKINHSIVDGIISNIGSGGMMQKKEYGFEFFGKQYDTTRGNEGACSDSRRYH